SLGSEGRGRWGGSRKTPPLSSQASSSLLVHHSEVISSPGRSSRVSVACALRASYRGQRSEPEEVTCALIVRCLFFFLCINAFPRDDASDPRLPAAAAAAAARRGVRGAPRAEEGAPRPRLPGPAGGDPGADVRAALGGSDERVPSRAAAGAAGQTQPDVPEPRALPGRRRQPPPGQPAQRVAVGLQDILRRGPVPALTSPEAYCLCRGCLLGPLGGESDLYRSTPVYAPSVLLRRAGSCAGGRHAYTELYVSIAVGCTCVPRLEKERGAPGGGARANAGRLVPAGKRT
uniref:Interleukin 17D n=1 Tax=Gasterosteus aculeatus aculeatus TaxID=481459 RepID=A0AAQ4PFL8_GASAC